MMEIAVENAANIFTVNQHLDKKDILCLDEYKGLYGGFVYRVVIMLDNTRSAFSEFYYEYYGIPRNTSSSAKTDRIW